MIDNKAQVWVSKGNVYFCILSDFLSGYRPTDKEKKLKVKHNLNDFFELYDDDYIKYYSGYANFDLMYDNDMDEFTILDMAMADSGCTMMKIRGKDGKMEIL